MKEKYIKNSIILFVCLIISKIIGALYKIPLSNILGTLGVGIYQMIYFVYSLFLVFITGSIPTYIAQKVSYFRATNNNDEISKLTKNAFALSIILGLLFSIILISLSKVFSSLQGNYDAYLGYITVAVSVVFSAVTSVIKGYFQGYEYMSPSAICGILEQVTKLLAGLIFASFLKKYGVIYSVCGAFLGVLISEVIAFVFMLIYYNIKKQTHFSKIKYVDIKNIFFGFSPLAMTNMVVPFANFIDSFLVVNLLCLSFNKVVSTSLFGIATGMISPIINFPILLCGTICTAILPNISFKVAQNKNVSSLCNNIIFFVFVLFVPCSFGLLSLSENIISIFFPSIELQFVNVATYYLMLMSFNIIWLCLFQIVNSFLLGFGKYKLPLITQIIGTIAKIFVLVILMVFTKLNILSLAIALNVGNCVSLIFGLVFLRKLITLNNSPQKLFLCLLSSVIMFFVVYFLNVNIVFNPILKIITLFVVGVLVYAFLCLCFNIVQFNQVKNCIKHIKLRNKN